MFVLPARTRVGRAEALDTVASYGGHVAREDLRARRRRDAARADGVLEGDGHAGERARAPRRAPASRRPRAPRSASLGRDGQEGAKLRVAPSIAASDASATSTADSLPGANLLAMAITPSDAREAASTAHFVPPSKAGTAKPPWATRGAWSIASSCDRHGSTSSALAQACALVWTARWARRPTCPPTPAPRRTATIARAPPRACRLHVGSGERGELATWWMRARSIPSAMAMLWRHSIRSGCSSAHTSRSRVESRRSSPARRLTAAMRSRSSRRTRTSGRSRAYPRVHRRVPRGARGVRQEPEQPAAGLDPGAHELPHQPGDGRRRASLKRSKDALVAEVASARARWASTLRRAPPGAHLGAGEEVGLPRVAESLVEVLERTEGASARISSRTRPARGRASGARFEQIPPGSSRGSARRRSPRGWGSASTRSTRSRPATTSRPTRATTRRGQRVRPRRRPREPPRLPPERLQEAARVARRPPRAHRRGHPGLHTFWRLANDARFAEDRMPRRAREGAELFKAEVQLLRGLAGERPAEKPAFALEVVEAKVPRREDAEG